MKDEVLYIRGERHRFSQGEGDQPRWAKSWAGAFERCSRLPRPADTSKITASYRDGILKVVMPAAASPSARKIPVTADASR